MRTAEALAVTAATWLPTTAERTDDAVARGAVSARTARRLGVRQVPVEPVLAAPEMAARAACRALARAGQPAEDVAAVIHAWTYFQGHDFWSPAAYVAAHSGAHHAVPVGVQQMCNGGATGLEWAAARLLADPGVNAALVTTGDVFRAPGFDRWRSDAGAVFGDGATAVVLRRCDAAGEPSPLRLLAICQASAPDLEVVYRSGEPFHRAARENGGAIDARRAKRAFLDAYGAAAFAARARQHVREALEDALAAAGLTAADDRIRCVLMPRLGVGALESMYLPVVEDALKADAVSHARETGHLGAGDLAANLTVCQDDGFLAEGEVAVLIGGGGGFTWSCAVVERTAAVHRTSD